MSESSRAGHRRVGLSKIGTSVLIVGVCLALVPFALTRNSVVSENDHALDERLEQSAEHVSALVAQARASIRSVAYALQTNHSAGTFQENTRRLVTPEEAVVAVALLDLRSPTPTLLDLTGKSAVMDSGKPLPPHVSDTARALTIAAPFTSTGVTSVGEQRHIGFLQGPPIAAADAAIYVEFAFDSADPAAINAVLGPQGDVTGALYAASDADPGKLVVAGTADLPLQNAVSVQVPAGSSSWLLQVQARHPLAGILVRSIPWITLAIGLLLAVLFTIIVEVVTRRRDWALGLIEERTQELEQSLTRLRETQELLIQKEKLAVIGQLASTIGHELRNPLGVITNALYLMRTSLGGSLDERVGRQLRTAEREVASATLIVSDLLGFARERQPIRTQVDLRDLIEESLSVVPPPDDIDVTVDIDTGIPTLNVDRDQLRQVLLNLVTNAYEAMPDGGVMRVETHAANGIVTTSVSDNGGGLDEEAQTHLFEPFFTQKTRGVGLGLAVSKRIVESHDGSIEVRSAPGTGTSFMVNLPADETTVVA